jgi:hypothetical protein
MSQPEDRKQRRAQLLRFADRIRVAAVQIAMLDKHAIYIDKTVVGGTGVPAELLLKRDYGLVVLLNGCN